jgi:hypothetical protein
MIARIKQVFSSHFFLGGMLRLSGFILLDKFLSFEVHDGSVLQHTSIVLLNIFYCELQALFVLLLYWALDKTEEMKVQM